MSAPSPTDDIVAPQSWTAAFRKLNAVLPPLAPDGPILTIRKFSGIRPDAAALLASLSSSF